jgi:hypothetical protein
MFARPSRSFGLRTSLLPRADLDAWPDGALALERSVDFLGSRGGVVMQVIQIPNADSPTNPHYALLYQSLE